MPEQNSSIFLKQQPWQREIEAAVNEPDAENLLQRVHGAEAAIFNRLQQLAVHAEERLKDQLEKRLLDLRHSQAKLDF